MLSGTPSNHRMIGIGSLPSGYGLGRERGNAYAVPSIRPRQAIRANGLASEAFASRIVKENPSSRSAPRQPSLALCREGIRGLRRHGSAPQTYVRRKRVDPHCARAHRNGHCFRSQRCSFIAGASPAFPGSAAGTFKPRGRFTGAERQSSRPEETSHAWHHLSDRPHRCDHGHPVAVRPALGGGRNDRHHGPHRRTAPAAGVSSTCNGDRCSPARWRQRLSLPSYTPLRVRSDWR